MESRKRVIEVAIIIVAALVLVARIFQISVVKKNGESQITIEVPGNFNLEEAKRATAGIGAVREKMDFSAKHLRDIFRKPAELIKAEEKGARGDIETAQTAPGEGALVLEGIMFGASEGNIAIISGKVVKEGDSVGSAKIEKIEQDRVILLKNGSTQELKK